jgi:hypothetical protein
MGIAPVVLAVKSNLPLEIANELPIEPKAPLNIPFFDLTYCFIVSCDDVTFVVLLPDDRLLM